MDDDTQPAAPVSQWRLLGGCLPFVIILGLAAMAFASLGHDTQPMAPEHPGDETWSWMIGVVLGLISFAGIISVPIRPRKTLLATGISLVVVLMAFPITLDAFERAHERAAFANARISRSVRFLKIESASIHHGKGGSISYMVWLTYYPVLLEIDKADYVAVFGNAERAADTEGYCVRAIVETAGKASRVLAKDGFGLPRGSLMRCPGR